MRSAIISDCRKYRYALTRKYYGNKCCMFIMLNPSTADECIDDPTVRKCTLFADSWGYGNIIIVNLFALRATDPKEIYWTEDPVGPDNHKHVKEILEQSIFWDKFLVVCAWGNHGRYMEQNSAMIGWLEDQSVKPHYLKMTKKKEPSHPLYLPKKLKPIPWEV